VPQAAPPATVPQNSAAGGAACYLKSNDGWQYICQKAASAVFYFLFLFEKSIFQRQAFGHCAHPAFIS